MDSANRMAIQLANWQSTAGQLAKDYQQQIEVMRKLGISEAEMSLIAERPPAGIRGSVTEIRLREGMVEISLGSDSGVTKGHQLDIVRNVDGRRSYVGKVEIVDASPDRAAARIMPEFRKGTIRQGDEVTYIEVNEFVAQ